MNQTKPPRLPWYMTVTSANKNKVEIKYHWLYISWLKARIAWRPYRAKLYRAYYKHLR